MLLSLKEQYITLITKNHIRFNIKKYQKRSINHCKQFLSSLIPFNSIFFNIIDNPSDVYWSFLIYTSLSFLFSGLIIKRKFLLIHAFESINYWFVLLSIYNKFYNLLMDNYKKSNYLKINISFYIYIYGFIFPFINRTILNFFAPKKFKYIYLFYMVILLEFSFQ